MFAYYIPSWSGAAAALPIQLAIIASIAVAIFIYARQRHAATVITLYVLGGVVLGTALGLLVAKSFDGYWRGPASFFELYRFQIAGSIGAVLGWLSLEAVAYRRRRKQRFA